MKTDVVDLNRLLTTRDMCRMFARDSEMTIQLWRKNDGMPFKLIPGEARANVRFVFEDVEAWAKKRGKRIFWWPKFIEKERGKLEKPIRKYKGA